jgi:hypothetical protein
MFLDLGLSPIADEYTSKPDKTVPTYPLQLAVCTGCRLVQLLDVVDHDRLFGEGYSFYSSASPPLSAYHERYAQDVIGCYPDLARRLTVEVGSNDGDFLRHFHDAGCQVLGVDPARGPALRALERGLAVIDEPFGLRTAARLHDQLGPAGVIVANHVLAHVESVSDVLSGIECLLASDGVVYIEVQYLPDLLVNNAFDLVYHEHRNFFSLTSLESAAQRWGLHVTNAWLTNRQGGSLRVELHRSRRVPPHPDVDVLRASEEWLKSDEAYRGFQGRVDRVRWRLEDLIYRSEPLLGYGAPAKATTLLHFCGIDQPFLDRIVDTTEAKQGMYVPGTSIPIVAPESIDIHDYPVTLLLAWNYLSQIVRGHVEYMARGGRWIVPVPSPMLL